MLQNKLHGFVGRFALAFFDYWSETLSNSSVNSKRALRSPRVFVILFWKSCKCLTVGPGIETKTSRFGA